MRQARSEITPLKYIVREFSSEICQNIDILISGPKLKKAFRPTDNRTYLRIGPDE